MNNFLAGGAYSVQHAFVVKSLLSIPRAKLQRRLRSRPYCARRAEPEKICLTPHFPKIESPTQKNPSAEMLPCRAGCVFCRKNKTTRLSFLCQKPLQKQHFTATYSQHTSMTTIYYTELVFPPHIATSSDGGKLSLIVALKKTRGKRLADHFIEILT